MHLSYRHFKVKGNIKCLPEIKLKYFILFDVCSFGRFHPNESMEKLISPASNKNDVD